MIKSHIIESQLVPSPLFGSPEPDLDTDTFIGSNMSASIIYKLGDAKELVKDLEPASIALTLTDPMYERYDDYIWLKHENQPHLKHDANVLAFTNSRHLSQVTHAAFDGECRPLGVHQQTNGGLSGDCIAKSYYLTWFAPVIEGKSRYRTAQGKMPDGWISNTWAKHYNPKAPHKWTKNPVYIELVLSKFIKAGGTVFDPFAGSALVGTICKKLNINYIGFEINPETFRNGIINLT